MTKVYDDIEAVTHLLEEVCGIHCQSFQLFCIELFYINDKLNLDVM